MAGLFSDRSNICPAEIWKKHFNSSICLIQSGKNWEMVSLESVRDVILFGHETGACSYDTSGFGRSQLVLRVKVSPVVLVSTVSTGLLIM